MKKLQKLCFLALVGLMVGTSCEKTTQAPDPNPQDKCIEGVVIAEHYVRSGYNPSILYACETIVQIKNRTMGIQWGKYNNCVIIKNLDVSLQKINQKVYFEAFTEAPQCGPWLADCSGGIQSCVIATNISTKCEAK